MPARLRSRRSSALDLDLAPNLAGSPIDDRTGLLEGAAGAHLLKQIVGRDRHPAVSNVTRKGMPPPASNGCGPLELGGIVLVVALKLEQLPVAEESTSRWTSSRQVLHLAVMEKEPLPFDRPAPSGGHAPICKRLPCGRTQGSPGWMPGSPRVTWKTSGNSCLGGSRPLRWWPPPRRSGGSGRRLPRGSGAPAWPGGSSRGSGRWHC
jgi:hypothetical protein